jgi:ubiquitin-like protein Nedd8
MNAIVIVNLPIQITLICIIATIPIQIFIKTLTGRKQAFNFEPENQVLAVKQALQEKEGIQVDQIRLIFSGKQLSDDRSLESYTITAGATIHMVLQLRGGR